MAVCIIIFFETKTKQFEVYCSFVFCREKGKWERIRFEISNKQQQRNKKKKNLNTAFRMLLGQARSQVPRNRSQNRDRLDSRLQSDTTEGKNGAVRANSPTSIAETRDKPIQNEKQVIIFLFSLQTHIFVAPMHFTQTQMFTAKYALRGGFVRQCCAVQSNVACSLTRRSITSAAGGRLFSQHGRPAAVVRGSCRIHTRPDDEVHNEQLRAKVEGRSEAERVCVASALHTHRAE